MAMLLRVILVLLVLGFGIIYCNSYFDELIDDLPEFYTANDENFKDTNKHLNDDREKHCKPRTAPRTEFVYSSKDVDRTINVITNMVNYFERYVDGIITDGLYGLRAAQGIFQGLKGVDFGPHQASIKHLSEYITRISETIYDKIVHKKDSYDRGFFKILSKPQIGLELSWKRLKSLEKYVWKDWKTAQSIEFHENESDHCYQLLFGTTLDSNGQKCVITEKCKKMMTRPKTKGYVLTHQVLYFQLAIRTGCRKQLEDHFGGKIGLQNIFNVFAANVGTQATAERRIETLSDLDIQIEQLVICASLKVVECNSKKFYEKMMKSIDAKGCVVDPEGEIEQSDVIEKRRDKEIGSCWQHPNTLAIMYFTSTLKFIFDPPSCQLLQ